MNDSTRDLAMLAASNASEIKAHKDECARRYQEGNLRLDKLFDLIEKTHIENRKDIGEIKSVLAEQRGANKMARLMGSGIAATVGGLSGFISGFIVHK